jgi:tryptophan 2,3-dioxygenase
MSTQKMYYSHYLHLDKILDSQHPVSFQPPHTPAHDEMLFIVIHQAYELWFKQILFELDYIINVFAKEVINDNSEDLNLVQHRLRRIVKILELLNEQVGVLDTMTPLDFLEFRNLLTPSSGFQSVQFRLIEAKLGLEINKRHSADYYKRTNEGGFTQHDYATITHTESTKSLQQLINNWLERIPFFEEKFWKDYKNEFESLPNMHPFWSDYIQIYKSSLNEAEQGKAADFDYVFFEIKPDSFTPEYQDNLRGNFSAKALQAALFIMLYRDIPVFQSSYRILDSLVEIDHLMSSWRHRHLIMVRRMIGLRVGTGNTSGRGYLEGALNKHYVYRDIAGLSTYLIERKHLPKLPNSLIAHAGFNY